MECRGRDKTKRAPERRKCLECDEFGLKADMEPFNKMYWVHPTCGVERREREARVDKTSWAARVGKTEGRRGFGKETYR